MTTICISTVLHLQPFLHQNADVAQDDAPVLQDLLDSSWPILCKSMKTLPVK